MGKASQNLLKMNPFQFLYKPAQNPDLYLKENLWTYLEKSLHVEYYIPVSTISDLWGRVQTNEQKYILIFVKSQFSLHLEGLILYIKLSVCGLITEYIKIYFN